MAGETLNIFLLAGFVPYVTGLVLNKTGFVLIVTGFALNMTGFSLIMIGFVLKSKSLKKTGERTSGSAGIFFLEVFG